MQLAISIRLRIGLAVLLSLVCSSSLQAQNAEQTPSTQRAPLPMPMRIGPANRPAAPKANLANPGHAPLQQRPVAASSRGPFPSAAHPETPANTVNPIAFHIAPYADDGTFVNYFGNEEQYGAYIAVEGDFDHKNGLDVVTVQTDGTFNLMLNDGKGNFTKTFNLSASISTYANVEQGFAADVNGDGYLDVIVSTITPTTGFMVWINRGDGTFALPVTYTIPTINDPGSPYLGGMAVGDVNGDGKQDVVFLAFVAAPGGDPVSPLYAFTFLGEGDGTFPSTSVITNRTQLFTPNGGLDFGTATLADMNGDGKLDLVAAIVNTNNSTSGISAQYIGVSLGDGAGHFAAFPADTAKVEVPAPWTVAQQIQVLDLNQDGKPDVLWADSANTVLTSLGNGDGTLQAPITAVYANAGANSLTTGDFNQDGLPDVAVFTNGLTAIYAGAGDGTFAATPLAQYPNELFGNEPPVAQDFDGDGILDLIAVRPFFNQLAFLKGYGNGTFQSESLLLPSNTVAGGPLATEPAKDIIVLTTGKWTASGYPGVFAEEDIDGTFYLDFGIPDGHGGLAYTRALNAAQTSAHGVQAIEPIAADFNSDGLQDVVWTTGNGIAVGLSKGDGTFSSIVSTNFPTAFQCALGFADAADLNGDGKTDLVIAYSGDAYCNFNGTAILPAGFFVLLGDGTGQFTATFHAAGENIYKVKIASLKNDGVMDIVLDDQGPITQAIYSIAPTSPGVYTGSTTTIWPSSSTLADLLVQDLNGDGIPDLTLLQTGLPFNDDRQPGVLTLFGKGDGTFGTPQFEYAGIPGSSIQSADFNQDGLPDLAVAFGASGGFAVNGVPVFANLGKGTFGPPIVLPGPLNLLQPYGIPVGDEQIFTGDFNADGAPDILIGEGLSLVPGVLYLNQGGTSLQLVAGAASIPQYSPVTLTVLASDLGSTPPTGNISFYVNGASLGSATLANGSASFTSSSLPVGTDTIVARFVGSSTNYPAASNAAVVTVTALPPNFTLTAAASTLSVTSTTPASTILSLASNQSFQGSVSFVCDGLPAGVTCAFTPSTTSLAAGSTASVTVSVAYSNQGKNVVPHAGGQAVTALCGMLFLLCAIPGKRRRTRGCVVVLLVMASVMAGLSGCSNGSAQRSFFTANIAVVATGTSGTATLTQSVPLQVAIQP
jgi:hypothetical protein